MSNRRVHQALCALVGLVTCSAMLVMMASPVWAQQTAPSVAWLTAGVPPEMSQPMIDGPEGSVWVANRESVGNFGRNDALQLTPVARGGGVVFGLAAGPSGTVWELRSTPNVEEASEVIRVHGPEETQALWMPRRYGGSLASQPNGTLWIATNGETCDPSEELPCGPVIVRLEPDGAQQAFVAPVASRLTQLVIGADGNVWFLASDAELAGRRAAALQASIVGRLTPAGQFTTWTVETRSAPISGLAPGPGGIWFVGGSNEVGRVTYGGRVETFSKGIPQGARPDSITEGPEGKMWFTELDRDALGRVEAGGRVTQLPWKPVAQPRGSDAVGATGIVLGPHGTLIFHGPLSDEYGRVSPAGRCIVPDLSGLSWSQAKRALHEAGCSLGKANRGHTATVVATQRPRPGTIIRHDAPVTAHAISGRLAERRCILRPTQRDVLGDSKMVLAGENVSFGEEEPGVSYRPCVYGGDGFTQLPAHTKSAEWGGETVEMFTMAGDDLAWRYSYGVGGAGVLVSVAGIDAATGTSIGNSGDFPSRVPESGPWTEARVVDLAVDEEGDLAWILERPAADELKLPAVSELQVLQEGKPLTLESSPAGGLAQLSFDPTGTLHWTVGGQARTYAFSH